MFKRVSGTVALLAALTAGWFGTGYAGAQMNAGSAAEDKYAWLEDVSGERSMAWVTAENARTAKVLEGDPRYAANYDAALKVAEDPSRLPYPQLRGGDVYNDWRDAKNPRGLLRRTTLADYLTETPHWQPVIDYDQLGRDEKVGWVGRGSTCLYPYDRHCMVGLSAGGEDATTQREFDLKTGKFVPAGFILPSSKQNVAWVDADTLLVTRNWGGNAMTKSGYPFVVKEWRRGTPLESAKEIFRGDAADEVGSYPEVVHDGQGHVLVLVSRGNTFFQQETHVRTARGMERLAIPAKAEVSGMVNGRVLIRIREDWTPAGGTAHFVQGSLLEVRLADLLKDPAHLKPDAVFQPTAKEFLQEVSITRDRMLVTTLENVQGRAYIYTPAAHGWTKSRVALPDNVALDVGPTDASSNVFFLSVTGFLTPPSLWMGDASTGKVSRTKSQPPLFDASQDVVEQLTARSKDGTAVPYFVVHRKDMKYDGSNPTLLNAYGGFEISETPFYSAYLGKLWLEKGGVFVLANIRGGGEFGPAWHEAGLKTNRQRIYDDFAAVGQDLMTRKITSPRHLGIEGGSNGGLLMGVQMEQHPELWNAVVIQIPLLDMLGFEHIAAGASWVGEYGSTSVPEERAFLASISPYHQLKSDVKYPEPLIFTTTKDDRVGPQHARKFAARMKEFNLPYLYDEITEGGHGSGADLKQQTRTSAVTYTYLQRQLM